jgi:hypothetical protein
MLLQTSSQPIFKYPRYDYDYYNGYGKYGRKDVARADKPADASHNQQQDVHKVHSSDQYDQYGYDKQGYHRSARDKDHTDKYSYGKDGKRRSPHLLVVSGSHCRIQCLVSLPCMLSYSSAAGLGTQPGW